MSETRGRRRSSKAASTSALLCLPQTTVHYTRSEMELRCAAAPFFRFLRSAWAALPTCHREKSASAAWAATFAPQLRYLACSCCYGLWLRFFRARVHTVIFIRDNECVYGNCAYPTNHSLTRVESSRSKESAGVKL